MSFNSRKLLFGSSNLNDPYWNNVSLLLHGDGIGATPNGQQNNTFLDSSTNNTITRNGTPTQGSFSPYALNGVAYSPTLHGGGLYLNGTTDYLNCGAAILNTTGNFTIECWIYVTGGSGTQRNILGQYINGNANRTNLVVGTDNKISWSTVGSINELTSLNAISENIWTHVCIVRNGSGSNNTKMYINGIVQGSYTDTGNFAQTNTWIGQGQGFSTGLFVGYISNLRITNISVYTSNFTPPTSPVTLLSNGGATPSTAPTSGQVSLLCDFTNGGIFDNTKKNVLTTVGNARVSTAEKKFGTGSMLFNGSTDYLSTINKQDLSLGSGNFTIECWVYANSIGSFNGVFAQWPNNGGSVNNSFVLESVGSNMEFYWCAGSTLFGPATLGTITTGSWIHYAICKSGNTLYPFKNGVLGTTVSIAQTLNSPTSNITVGGSVAGSGYWNGYIDDLRITKGIARYTSAFTPPTRAFPNK